MIKKCKTVISSNLFKIKRVINNSLFSLTTDGASLRTLKNVHLNKRCFIIGNGPSLKAEDLDKLKNEITFGFNRIYYIFDKTDWRPTYYFSEDEKTIFHSKEEINTLNLPHKFFPVNFPWDYKINFKNAMYYILKYENEKVEPKFSDDIVKGIYWGNTVAYTAIQMAVFMGIKEIYLVGIDHNFSKMLTDKGEIVFDKNAKDYFTEEYNTDKNDLYIPNIDISTRAFSAAKKYAEKNHIKIFNSTRGGKLEVFERAEFDKISF